MTFHQNQPGTGHELVEAAMRDPQESWITEENVLRSHESSEVRAVAATLLATSTRGESVVALTESVDDPSASVRRRVARALGRLGPGPEALLRLRFDDDPIVGRDAAAALTLMSYRLSTPVRLVDESSALEVLRDSRGTPQRRVVFAIEGAPKSEPKAAERDLPTVEFADRVLAHYRCGKQEIDIVPTAGFADALTSGNFAERLATPQILAALRRHDVCTDHGETAAYVLSDDRDTTGGERVRLWIMRPNGTVLHGGELQVRDAGLVFRLDHSNPPYGPPLLVTGELDPRSLSLTAKGRVGEISQRQAARTPSALAGPSR